METYTFSDFAYDFAVDNDLDYEAFYAYCCHHNLCHHEINDYKDDYIRWFRDEYEGEFSTPAEFAKDWAEGKYPNIPLAIRDSVDWGKVWDTIKDDYYELNGHYFRNV
jgi:hypothetical protein